MANSTSEFQGDEFSNNLFTDLGPLLALFGERVATQYLRHSTSKLESLIFACAPLGILTAVISAIRIGGSRKLKALIGRAEEPDAVAEIELVSSTSADVCELWNGVGLVRIVGKPHILELVIDEELLRTSGEPQTSGTISELGILQHDHGLYTRKEGMKPLEADVEQSILAVSIAPNISLNTIGGFINSWEVYVVAVIGVILQLAVLAIDAAITYHWRLLKAGRHVASYAFPLTCIGTLGIVFGMYLCAYIIEVSTKELQWLPNTVTKRNSGDKRYRILWVQKGQTVGDQGFGSYAIYAPSENHTLMTSHRQPEVALKLHGLTITATVVSFGAFILQFVGLRAMHYSAFIAQLGATIIMIVLRVAIRRHISQEPQKHTQATVNETAPPVPQRSNEFELIPLSGPKHQDQDQHPGRYTVQELIDEYELDMIAMKLQECKLWQVVTFWWPDQDTRPPTDISAGKLAENVLETRIRLMALLQSPWHTGIAEQAKMLSETMADMMNFLWNSDAVLGSVPKLTADFASMKELCWNIPIEIRSNGSNGNSVESISLSLTRQQLADDKWKPWEADVIQVEALLQLWMLRLSTYTKGEANVLWVLCPGDDYTATIIVDWWVGRDAGCVSDKTLEAICKEYGISTFSECYEGSSSTGLDIKNYIIGCIGFNPDTPRPVDNKGYQVTQAIVQHTGLGTFAAQYILHTFLARLAHSIDEVTTPTVVRDEQATGPLLRNDTITDLALKVQERGLCTIAEAYRMVLCAFTAAGKLPVPYRQSADPFLVLYQKALELGHKFKGKNNKSSPAALRAEKIYEEALSLCRYKALGLINDNRWVDAGALVVRAARISENFSTTEGEHMKEMRDLMLLVGSKFVSNSPIGAGSVDATDKTSPRAPRARSPMISPADLSLEPISASSKLITAVRSQNANVVQKLLLEAVNDNSTDSSMDKARALDRATQRGNKEILILLHLYGTLPSSAPLWWAVYGIRTRNISKGSVGDGSVGIEIDYVEVLKLLLDFGHDPNKLEPKAGESPLHLAAKLNLVDAMSALLAKVEPPSTRICASVDLMDQNGLSPFYHAAKEGHGIMAKLLVNHGANVSSKSETGPEKKSPIHYAVIQGDRVVLNILYESGGDIEVFDSEGKSPLYYAAMAGSGELVETLLEMGADINRKCPQSRGERTTLHWTALEGNAAAMHILLEKKASLDEGDEAGRTALHHAVIEGQRAAVYVLLEKGAALDKKDMAGKTPLACAKDLPHGGVGNDIIWMLEHGSDMKLDEQGKTALHRAASNSPGDELAVEILLRCGTDRAVNVHDDQLWTPLHLAASKGHERIVQMLLDKSAEVNAKEKTGMAPLHLAANIGHEQIVHKLLDKGAEVNVKKEDGWTPLHDAVIKGHERIVQMLLEKGAEVNAKEKTGMAPLHLAANKGHEQIAHKLLDKGAEVNVKEEHEWTPLYLAASAGREQMVQVLLDKGAEVNVEKKDGWTPLHDAVFKGHERMVQMLLENNADVNAKEKTGMAPLHLAANKGDEQIVHKLLDKRAKVNVKEEHEWTPLFLAASGGHEQIVQVLLDKGAEVNVETKDGWTPLHDAVFKGHERIVQMLLENGFEVNIRDKRGWVPLHGAAYKGYERIVLVLLDNGAEVGVRDEMGWTPLHYAALNGHAAAIQILLHKGADFNIASINSRYTPLHNAARGQHPQVIQLLVDNGANLHSTDSESNTPEHYATMPLTGVKINPEVAEVFRALRNRITEGTATQIEGKSIP